jgi:hypothetical protein
VYVLSSGPLSPIVLPPDFLLEEERRYQGRTLERWAARVRIQPSGAVIEEPASQNS